MYKIIVFIHKVTEIQRRKKFSILCFTQQLVIEPEGVLNRYKNAFKNMIQENNSIIGNLLQMNTDNNK